MPTWTSPPQLVVLAAFYAQAQALPDAFSDAAFLDAVKAAHWPTNCWSYMEASFAIIAPACLLRPHLTAELIAMPIDAMIAGGLDDAGKSLISAWRTPGATRRMWCPARRASAG